MESAHLAGSSSQLLSQHVSKYSCAVHMWHAAVLATKGSSLFWKLLMALFAHLFPLLREAANSYRDLLCYYDKKLFWRKVGLVLWTPRSLLQRPPACLCRGRYDAVCSWNP